MKQQITKEQWEELEDENKIKMFDWVEGYYPESRNTGICRIKGKLPSIWDYATLSIGQIIEFLEKDHTVDCKQWDDEWKSWRVGLDWLDKDNYEFIVEKKELCDALWESVKYKLCLKKK